MTNSNQKGTFNSIGDVLKGYKESDEDKQSLSLKFPRNKYISREFQKYGYELAEELGDLKSKSLYIKLAKTIPRAILEKARSFLKDAPGVKSRPRLFMWKVKQLRDDIKKGNNKSKIQISNDK